MAVHYQNGGLPPWAAGNGHPVNSPSLTLSNDYNTASSVNTPPTNWDPRAQYEDPTRFGNVPPSSIQTKAGPYNAPEMPNPPLGLYSPLPNVYTPQTGTSSVTRDTFNIASGQNSGPTSGQNSGPTSLDLHELIPRKLEEEI